MESQLLSLTKKTAKSCERNYGGNAMQQKTGLKIGIHMETNRNATKINLLHLVY